MIVLENLTKHFGQLTAVDSISLNVDRKQVLGFLGPNGAGKSTTMKMISGFLEPSSGTALVAGYDILENPVKVKSKIGYLPEGAPTYGDMTPQSFLDFVAEIRGFSGRERGRKIAQVTERVRLEDVMFQPIETLSKGFKRRVGLAQAMIHDPEVLILDEPTDGLDPNQKHHVRKLINEMAQEKAIIVSTHILEEVEAVCTDAVIISGGKLLKSGTPEELLEHDSNHNSIVVLAKNSDIVQVRESLDILGSVIETETGADEKIFTSLRITLKDKNHGLKQVNSLIREKDLNVEEVYLAKGALDKVFRNITTKEKY